MKLPFHLQRPFFKVILENDDIKALETWIYHEPSLEEYLSPDDYLMLIGLDFNNKKTVIELEKLISPYLEFLVYYQNLLKQTLSSLINNPDDFYKLSQIYDWYCQGYYFLRKLALTYGLSADLPFYDESYQNFQFSDEALAEIAQQALWLYNDLICQNIVLSNPPSYDVNTDHFQDFRDDAERARTDLP
ncbi:hypothetical protein MBO_06339 [Moraxella bovoculi 237]|uniref:Uncharacterized protein n=1 Tax=Moraxella bovoculi 237 TaxID=743974 RepID=A0A066UL90_9GAMM|nr:hypothetical protein [Moraxella bovoculi]KDN24988.1 hypothetical protein MBO_06339 [Moraxella bovoculi 237]